MPSNLFIIEAPGKRRALFDVLRRAGVRDIDVEATVGHLAANPDKFTPLAVDSNFRETAYRIRPDREALAATIAYKAAEAKRIYLATDSDQEGDVIARDVWLFCIPEEHRHKAVRVRLKALSESEVLTALSQAKPFDELMAAQGDARRVIDRLIGATSNKIGAIGRVQGSLLIALMNKRPVVGVVSHTLDATDGRGPFVAKVPVFAGQQVPDVMEFHNPARVRTAVDTARGGGPMNHDQILLAASLRTGAGISDVSKAMQTLYEKGRMTYPRSKDSAISSESLKRLSMIARGNGAAFRGDRFTGVRDVFGEHGHEAPNPLAFDVPVNRNFELLSLEDQVLVVITQNLIDSGIAARFEKPDTSSLPDGAKNLNWHRINTVGTRLWVSVAEHAGMEKWSKEQSLLHFMMKNQLGRPSTITHHIEKFLTRDLVTQAFDLTGKGKEWSANIGSVIGYRNISTEIEKYIENNRNVASSMVADMVQLFELHSIKTLVEQETELTDHETYEISSGSFP